MNDLLLKKYAELLIKVGLNVQKGQTVLISCPVDCAPFGRLCIEEAYRVGCREVVMKWEDDFASRQKGLYAEDSVFDECPDWREEFFNHYSEIGSALLSIYATDPENMKGVDPSRLQRAQIAAGKKLKVFQQRQMASFFPWCVASVPTLSWAKKVFPDKSDDEAMSALWEAIMKTVRINEETDPVAEWNAHINKLATRCRKLNEYAFIKLHYSNSLGTNLTVELPKGHIWMGGSEKSASDIVFVANMPTEEVFTAPKRDGVNGIVYSSMPFSVNGTLVDKFSFTFKDGKIVGFAAEKGAEVLEKAISVDEGASYLGEVALIPVNSPICEAGLLFYNTLFDENASCHFAFGDSYPCIENGASMSKEELKARGLNESVTHEDFMVGTPDMQIKGITADGREIDVFVNGHFAGEFDK